MRSISRARAITNIILLAVSCTASGTAVHAQNLLQSTGSGIAVWDTGNPSNRPLDAASLAQTDNWTRIPRNEKPSSFHGDALINNGRILAVFRKRDSAVEVYSTGPERTISRSRLQLLGPAGEPATRLERVSVVENTRGAARLEAAYQTTQGALLIARFRLKRGEISLETESVSGAVRLRVESPGRFVVLPDFFADDILCDARKLSAPVIELPSENLLLHLTADGDAVAMCVFENREQDVKVYLSGENQQRIVTGSEIVYGKDQKIWVAIMEGKQIWHSYDVKSEQAAKVIPLDWRMPYVAQWRIDFTRPNELTDSWEMLLAEKNAGGCYLKPTWMGRGATRLRPDRKRWTTVLGRFQYPCWTDLEGRGYLQPLQHRELSFRGPSVIYPINRVGQTPTDAYTVVDVLRNCLGVGPCEYILKVESQKQEYKGRATCSARDALTSIYQNKQQKQKRAEIESALDDALTFVTHIRNRITHFVEFGHETRKYLAEQQEAHPELAAFLTEMDKIAAELDSRMAKRRHLIRTPAFVAQMNQDFRKDLLSQDGSDTLQQLKKYTDTLTQIGGNQDELVGECRWTVRNLRQRAGIMMATDPRCAKIANEIRARAQVVLLKPTSYEAARH